MLKNNLFNVRKNQMILALTLLVFATFFNPATTLASSIIPFNNGTNTSLLTTNSTGDSSNVQLVGFGNRSLSIALQSDGTFTLPPGDGYQFTFTMPRSGNLESISATFLNFGAFTPTANSEVYPYVAIAIAPPGSNMFKIIEESKTSSSEPWMGGATYPANTVLSGNTDGICYTIPEGYRVAIVNGFDIRGSQPYAASYYFYYTGGVSFR